MLSLETVEQEILELEKRDTTYAVCERLAWLYVVRDHMTGEPAREASVTSAMSGSEFLEAASGVDHESLMRVLDEHMDCARTVCPKEYEAVMSKIRSL